MTADDEATYRGSMPRDTAQLNQWHAGVPTEAALDPNLPIVDPHHHIFGSASDTHHYRMEELLQDLSTGHRVVGTVYMEAYRHGWRSTGPEAMRSVGEVEHVRNLTTKPIECAHGPCRVGAAIVSNVDLTLGENVAAVLDAHIEAACGRLRGVRDHLATDDGLVGRFIAHRPRPHLLRDPQFRKGLSCLERLDLSFDAWLYHHQIQELIEVADAFPYTRFILNHAGALIGVGHFRTNRREEVANWRRDLRLLALRPNVAVKIGGMGMPVFGFGFEHAARPATSNDLLEAWRPLIDTAIEAFGTRRSMFESNFPPDRQSCGYAELWNTFKRATRAMSHAERGDLFYRTACRTYRMPELEALSDLIAEQSPDR